MYQLRPRQIVLLVVFMHSLAWGCKSHGKIPLTSLPAGAPSIQALIARSAALSSQTPSRPGGRKSLGVSVGELQQDFADAMALLQAEDKFLQDGENAMAGEGYKRSRIPRGEDNRDGYKQQEDSIRLRSKSVGEVQRDHARAVQLLQTQNTAEQQGYKRIKFQHAEDNTAVRGDYKRDKFVQAEDNAADYRQHEDDTDTMPNAEPESGSAEPGGAEPVSNEAEPGAEEQMHKRRVGSASAKVCARICGGCSSFLGIRWSSLCWKHCAINGDAFRACLVVTSSTF